MSYYLQISADVGKRKGPGCPGAPASLELKSEDMPELGEQFASAAAASAAPVRTAGPACWGRLSTARRACWSVRT